MSPETCHPASDPQLVGDPVDTLTGALLDQMLDFRLTGPLELRWSRHYHSLQSHRSFSVGRGCAHEFDRRLSLDADGVLYEEPARRSLRFPTLTWDGALCMLHGFKLARVSSTCYTLESRAKAGMEFRFERGERHASLRRLWRGSAEVRFHYDEAQRLVAIDDSAGRRLTADSDDAGRLHSLHVERPDGALADLLIAYRYDAGGNLVATRDRNGHGYEFAYDEAHRMVWRKGRQDFQFHFTYDGRGRCSRAVGDEKLYGVALDYTHEGRLTRVTRPDRGIWTYAFGPRGHLDRVVDALGGTRRFVRSADGRLLVEIDANGNATRYVHDAAGEAIARIDPQGQWIALPEEPNAPDPAFHRVAATPAEYSFGRLPKVADAKLPDEGTVAHWHLPTEVRAGILRRPANAPTVPAPPFEVPPLRTKWWPPPESGRVFTDLGKLVRQHDEQGRERHWRYDGSGNPVEFTDFDGGRWTYEYGVWHFLTRMANPLGAAVSCSYTPYGLLSACTDAAGNTSEYGYDLAGQLIEVRRHGRTKERYERDACGNLVAKYGADNALLLAIEIGSGNLPVAKRLASGEELSYRYDGLGRPVHAASRNDAIALAYDDFGNCILETRNGCGIEAHFEQLRAPDELVFAGRFAFGYRRDGSGSLVLTDPTGAAHVLRQQPGGLLELQFSNGSTETCQFDERGRFLFKCARRRLANLVWSRRFHWSGEGELRAIEDSAGGDIRCEYDAAHRLQRRHVGARTEEFRLDAADNLLEQPGLGGVRLLQGNRLQSANGFEFTYYGSQHIETRGTGTGPVRYFHDSRDQLVRAELPEGEWSAEYDAFGRRVRKTWKGRTTEFHWYGDQLVAEVDPEGRLRLYIHADPLAAVPIMFIDYASVDAPPATGSRYFLFTDQLGAPCLVEDDAGNCVWAATISPYGLATIASQSTIEFNLRHPGQYFDAELGLHYNRFRYYDPVLGRYIESDPWGITGGPNLYAYRTNPLLVADVRGLGEEHGPDGKKVPKDEEGNHISPLTGEPVEGSVKVCQKTEDGKVVARYYVDEHGRTVRAEGLLDPPASRKKEGVGHVTPEGYESGRDHRGHLIPERSAASQSAVNVPENVIAEHGTKSNLSEKKRWENAARKEADKNPGTWSVHEPHYDGDNPRPSAVTHSLTDSDGNQVPNSSKTIPNPED